MTSLDGQSCTVRVPCNVWCLPFSLTCCDTRAVSGVWDASEGKCVDCILGDNREFVVLGDNSNPYIYLTYTSFDVTTYTLQNPGEDCLPGEPPKRYDAVCGIVDDCTQCGCPLPAINS